MRKELLRKQYGNLKENQIILLPIKIKISMARLSSRLIIYHWGENYSTGRLI